MVTLVVRSFIWFVTFFSDDSTTISSGDSGSLEYLRGNCCICLQEFDRDPKIRCADCSDVVVCIQCFSLGLETRSHKSYHRYSVDRQHIPFDAESTWSLQEDATLLHSLIECGYGNEVDIGKKLRHRSNIDINDRIHKILNLDKAPLQGLFPPKNQPVIKYRFDVICEEPPRYPSAVQARHLARYSASRGEFPVQYKNNAEEFLNNIKNSDEYDPNDLETHDALTYALTLGHNLILRERDRRKLCIKNHGLLLRRMNKAIYHRMAFTAQLLCEDDFELFNKGLILESKLTLKLKNIIKFREMGMRWLREVKLYDKLLDLRVNSRRELATIKQLPKPNSLPAGAVKKKPIPSLDVSVFRGYELLSPEEKDLCANARVLPEVYLKFKHSMIAYNTAEGSVPLKLARKTLSVDVNKTRKLYDFLCKEGLIKQPT